MAAEPAASNSQETRKRVPGKPFEKGNKLSVGNKGGRPKLIARRIRDEVEQGDTHLLVTIMVQLATGYRLLIPPAPPEAIFGKETPEAKTAREQQARWEEVSVADQRWAIQYLTDRGYGKAAEVPVVDLEDPLELGPDIAAFTDDFRQAIDEIGERRRARQAEEAARAAEQ